MTDDTTPTDEQLAAWQRLAEEATPGPWRWWTSNSFRRLSSDATGKDGDVISGTIQRSDGHPDVCCSDADKDFIAAAREAVPTLIAALRRERAALTLLDGCAGSLQAGIKILKDEIARLRTERDEARRIARRAKERWEAGEGNEPEATSTYLADDTTMATWPKEETR